MMGVLPPFHSFGFTATLWAPLTLRMRVVYHPNPLDAKGVGRMVAKYRATIIAGTSSFFALYARGCEPEQFRSLRLAVAGAQKLVAGRGGGVRGAVRPAADRGLRLHGAFAGRGGQRAGRHATAR